MGHRGGFTIKGGGLFPVKNFDVDMGGDVVHNQGVRGRAVHGWVMVVHRSLMADV